MNIFLIFLSGILLLSIIGFIVNKVFFSKELDNILPYGKLVNVSGQNMHIYSMGEGEKTIVLLPGLGIPLPSADFGPLMRELSKEYTVVCIEYFGVGFSDKTKIPRTNENYKEETRRALSSAGFTPPYVLMPHSASGIYCEYYATKHPNEVSAIIMLDTTSSAIKDANIPKFVWKLGKMQQEIGLNRIFNLLAVKLMLKEENGYTKEEIRDYSKFINHANNDTTIDQSVRFNDNILEVKGMDFPDEVPILKIVSSDSIKLYGEEYQTNHVNRLGATAQIKIIKGSHMIYHTSIKEIYEAIKDFLSSE